MERIVTIIILIIIMTGKSFSQTHDLNNEMFKIISKANSFYKDSLDDINYLKPWLFLEENKEKFIKSSEFENTYMQFLNINYSRLHLFDKVLYDEKNVEKVNENITYEATSYISDISKEHQIIMLNESHHRSSHRLFAETLLKPLKNNGYKYLAIETLNWKDSLINKRKYPISISGFYSREPYFGNFIRTALELGYTLISYESKIFYNDTNKREEEQSNNLVSFIRNNPNEKVYVYAGYSHINENNANGDIKWMAERLKKTVNIDPLTINQTSFRPNKKIKYNYVMKNEFLVTQNLVGEKINMFDLFLVNPFNQDSIHKKLNRKQLTIKINSKYLKKKPVLIQSFIYDEYVAEKNKAIPFDQKVIMNSTKKVSLFLNPEKKYFFCLKDADNNIIKSLIIDKQFSSNICLN